MKKLSTILSMLLIFVMTSTVYASEYNQDIKWKRAGVLRNGIIELSVRPMTEGEKADIRLREATATANQDRTTKWEKTGVLSNGIEYSIRPMTKNEKTAFNKLKEIEEANESEIIVSPCSYSWAGNVNVPIANSAGTNGRQLGKNFIIAPDNYAYVYIGPLPSTMPTVNIGAKFTNGMGGDWIPNIGGDTVIRINPGSYSNYEMAVKVSTYENKSVSAYFKLYTDN